MVFVAAGTREARVKITRMAPLITTVVLGTVLHVFCQTGSLQGAVAAVEIGDRWEFVDISGNNIFAQQFEGAVLSPQD